MPTGHRRLMLRSMLIVIMAVASTVMPAQAGDPAADPSVRLIAPRSSVVIHRYKDGPANLDAGVLVAAVHGDFALYATRQDHDHAVAIWQDMGSTRKRLPDWVADGLAGIDDFFSIRLWDRDGDLVFSRRRDFCPTGEDVRVTAAGPLAATYPRYCEAGPFMLGTVWGIDRGWAVHPFGWDGPGFRGPDGRYTMRMSIARRYRDLLGIAPAHASVTVDIRIRSSGDGCIECPRPGMDVMPGSRHHSFPSVLRGPVGAAPTIVDPPRTSLPDLRALPAWSVDIVNRPTHERIQFAATVWNAGPGTMLVEGFRRGDEPVMNAYQYFMRDGEAVGRARVGQLEYHAADHNHWHFLQFARYSLLDASMERILVSRKQAFCLVPTDAIDLSVKGADWRPGDDGLGTSCGSYDPDAVWTRETLQAGWGDTYYQVQGTSLDVAGLPNGIYYLSVEANPQGLLYETDTSNNVELRKIRLGGSPGARTLRVFAWHGINA